MHFFAISLPSESGYSTVIMVEQVGTISFALTQAQMMIPVDKKRLVLIEPQRIASRSFFLLPRLLSNILIHQHTYPPISFCFLSNLFSRTARILFCSISSPRNAIFRLVRMTQTAALAGNFFSKIGKLIPHNSDDPPFGSDADRHMWQGSSSLSAGIFAGNLCNQALRNLMGLHLVIDHLRSLWRV